MGGAPRVKLLLDTHIWLWSLLEPARLSRRIVKALEANEIWISPISAWEIIVLCRKNRIELNNDPAEWITDALARAPFHEAPLTMEIALATKTIVLPHRDPADRFLAATAKVYNLTLVTADRNLLKGKGYAVLGDR
jgi:PIN domain nuclease of toxin-antitoxin system